MVLFEACKGSLWTSTETAAFTQMGSNTVETIFSGAYTLELKGVSIYIWTFVCTNIQCTRDQPPTQCCPQGAVHVDGSQLNIKQTSFARNIAMPRKPFGAISAPKCTHAHTIRCVWSFRNHSPGKHWLFHSGSRKVVRISPTAPHMPVASTHCANVDCH